MAVFKLPRLVTGWKDQPELLERYWDIAMGKIEVTLQAILDIPAIQTALTTVNAAAAAANAAAATANAAASTIKTESSIVDSYISGFTAPLISCTAAGVVTIANHQRVYGDTILNPTVSVTGGTINTGQVNPAVVRVYYTNPARNGGAVSYLYTVDPATPPVQTGSTHSVGAVTVPAAGSANGKYVTSPGFVEP